MRIPAHLVRPGDIVLNRRVKAVTTHPDNENVTRMITEDGVLDTYRGHEINVRRDEDV